MKKSICILLASSFLLTGCGDSVNSNSDKIITIPSEETAETSDTSENTTSFRPLREMYISVGITPIYNNETKAISLVDTSGNEVMTASYDDTEVPYSVYDDYEVTDLRSVGKLTDEEKAYLTAFYNFFSEENCKTIFQSLDIDDMTYLEANEAFSATLTDIYANSEFKQTPVPESLDTVNNAASLAISLIGKFTVYFDAYRETSGDEVQIHDLGFNFYPTPPYTTEFFGNPNGLASALYQFYTENNIDPVAELGDIYIPNSNFILASE